MLILPSLSPFKTEPWHLILTFRQEKKCSFFFSKVFIMNLSYKYLHFYIMSSLYSSLGAALKSDVDLF